MKIQKNNSPSCKGKYFFRIRPINPIGNRDELTKRKYNAPYPPNPPGWYDVTINTKTIQNKANKILTMLTLTVNILSFSFIFLSCLELFCLFINQSFWEVSVIEKNTGLFNNFLLFVLMLKKLCVMLSLY